MYHGVTRLDHQGQRFLFFLTFMWRYTEHQFGFHDLFVPLIPLFGRSLLDQRFRFQLRDTELFQFPQDPYDLSPGFINVAHLHGDFTCFRPTCSDEVRLLLPGGVCFPPISDSLTEKSRSHGFDSTKNQLPVASPPNPRRASSN
jgi:hypothetical protein